MRVKVVLDPIKNSSYTIDALKFFGSDISLVEQKLEVELPEGWRIFNDSSYGKNTIVVDSVSRYRGFLLPGGEIIYLERRFDRIADEFHEYYYDVELNHIRSSVFVKTNASILETFPEYRKGDFAELTAYWGKT